jgi:hypothetical protein
MRHGGLVSTLALALVLAAPSAASAQLSLGVTVPASAMADLAPGQTGTSSSVFAVTSLGSWYLKARGASSPTPGHMRRLLDATCTEGDGDPHLGSPLTVHAEPLSGISFGPLAMSASDATLARGTSLATTVNVAYTQPVAAAQRMKAGCVYSITIVYTLTAGP